MRFSHILWLLACMWVTPLWAANVTLVMPDNVTPLGSSANFPLFVTGGGGGGGGGSVTQGTSPWVDNITQWSSVALGAPTAYGTAPTGIVPGFNAFVTNPVALSAGTATIGAISNTSFAATQSGTWTVTVNNFPATQAVSNAGTFAVQNTATTPAGTNIIGKVGIDQSTPGTTNKVTLGSDTVTITGPVNLTPGTTAALAVPVYSVYATAGAAFKGAPGNLYGYDFTQGATAGYVAILNVVATPAASAAISPLQCVYVAANGSAHVRQDIPDRYSTGITMVSTSSCATYTAVTPVLMSVLFE